MFFKSKKKEKNPAVSKEETTVRENKEKLKNKITVHTMPKKFLSGHDKASQAKKTGMAILASGAVFLVALIALLYFYFFVSPKINQKNNNVGNVLKTATTSVENSNSAISPEKTATSSSNNTAVNEENNIENSIPNQEHNTATTTVASTTVETVASSTEAVASTTPPEVTESNSEDSDGDGLNNVEEIALGTNLNLSDSDRDGYTDYQEIMNLYNPIGDGSLIHDPNINQYQSDKYGYSLLYPANWQKSSINNNDSIMFKSDDNHIIQVITQANQDIKTISGWYELQFGVKPDSKNMISGDGWKGIRSDDGLVVYITDNAYNYIYTFSYVPEYQSSPVYENIFEMMIKSFTVK